ncbi:hypothetical protein EV586_102158 [Tumebacillus sp. BK434]|uniref:hypothetical protein n=1 Tax=Tumebacillus sp. BK434 TaxID=2512169 RepID=UPI001045963E|nr:hypothetical protein [Tumebacillus sp. BK434]TCP57714.1 hypothetical protein EV586_102158 [Tumebacillus sp. BK434]
MAADKKWMLLFIFLGFLFALFITFGRDYVEHAPLIGWGGAVVCYGIAYGITRTASRRKR